MDSPQVGSLQPSVRRWCYRIALAAIVVLVIVIVWVRVSGFIRGEKFTIENTIPVKSNFDGMTYRVHPSHEDPRAAANQLAKLNGRLISLMRHLKHKYGKDASDQTPRVSYPMRARAVDKLLQRYNPDNLTENSPLDPSGDTSYVTDKGSLVSICLRERDPALKKCLRYGCNGVDPLRMQLHDLNVTTFVAIHEMSHIAIDATQHPPEFWSTFKFLLEEADAAGILKASDVNFNRYPVVYCGMNVDYNPLLDSATPTIQ